MKKHTQIWFAILFIVFNSSCKTNENLISEKIKSVLVEPSKTDSNYSATEQSHFVVTNSDVHINKLLLFIGGSYSIPKDYKLFCNHAATIGLDVISLSYPNDVATAPLGASSDMYIFDNYREELSFGNPVSNEVNINLLNSIVTRATKLVLFLADNYPDQNWRQYLNLDNSLKWENIIVAGHSQGSGHACYLGKKKVVSRVVMFSGPNDYSTYYSAPANWLTQAGKTPLTSYFALLHTKDEIVSFDFQIANLRALGLLSSAQSPLIADNLVSPYQNTHSLSLGIPAISYHSSTVGGNAILPSIWTYLLTSQ